MSTQPPEDPVRVPEHGSLPCPRCSATIGAEQDWCLECGAPARTRLAPTPNWRLPTIVVVAMVALAGGLLAFSFVTLTDDGGAPAGATPTAVETTPAESIPPSPIAPAITPTATTTAPAEPSAPDTAVPGQTAPAPAPTPQPPPTAAQPPAAPTPDPTATTAPGTATPP